MASTSRNHFLPQPVQPIVPHSPAAKVEDSSPSGPKVVEILPDGNAVVDTHGLFRVVIQPEGAIAEELLERGDAQVFVDTFNQCSRGMHAEMVSYLDLAPQPQ